MPVRLGAMHCASACALWLLLMVPPCTAATSAPRFLDAHAIKVIDGDSLVVRDSNRLEHEVRIAAIDAPERKQPYYTQSRRNVERLVLDKDVRLELQPKRDRYGRMIAKVWVLSPDAPCAAPSCPKTLDVGHAQIVAGLAWHYKRYEHEQSPQDRGSYSSDEDEARLRKRGLWSLPDPTRPEDWRVGLEHGPIKKSRSSICHSPEMPSYRTVKHFESFPTIEACLASGGRLPKSSGS